MNEGTTKLNSMLQRHSTLRIIAAIAVVIVLALIVVFAVLRLTAQPIGQSAGQSAHSVAADNIRNVPTNPAIEDRWGIRVTQIGVTADGGLVDFRYMVLDSTKALDFAANGKNVPTLIVEGSGAQITSAALMPHKHDLHAGVTYFLLYQNTRGALRSGSRASVVIGDLRLEHVPVL